MDLLKAGELGLGYVKSLGMPLSFAKKACGIGSAFSYTKDLSQKVRKTVKIAVGSSNFSALALDTLKLIRSCNFPNLDPVEISKLALSVLKKGCSMLKWLEAYRFIPLESALLGRINGAAILSDLTKASMRLGQAVGRADRDLVLLSISKVLKSSLLLYSYLADDKRVKVVIKGIGFMSSGYCLYQKCRDRKPREWTITRRQVCQIISSIALAALAFYGVEKGFFAENSR
jgi:hypothetical protein